MFTGAIDGAVARIVTYPRLCGLHSYHSDDTCCVRALQMMSVFLISGFGTDALHLHQQWRRPPHATVDYASPFV